MGQSEQLEQEPDLATGLPVGLRVAASGPAARPERRTLEGRYCRLEPLDPSRHGDDLFTAVNAAGAAARFLYLAEDPEPDRERFQHWLERVALSEDPLYFAVLDKASGRAHGRQTLMRIDPANRVIETGHIFWGPAIARTRIATEANYLFAAYVFDRLGYRRFEWKCNALNAPSRRAALRFGFGYEGLFRQAVIIKGRNRDTTWYAMTDGDWRHLKPAYERWLDPANFNADGSQRVALGELTRAALARQD
jgi:RimJ/RimL family protein N-acetyltransferase